MMEPSGATGRMMELLPPGPERDEIIGLIRLGVTFKRQHRGKRPEFLHRHIKGIVDRLEKPVTFKYLLDELELEAARRKLDGEDASPIESVNRVWDLLTYHDPKKGRVQRTFKHLQNILTACKKA